MAEVELLDCPTAYEDGSVDDLRAAISPRKIKWGIVLDARDRPIRWVSLHHLATATSLHDLGDPIDEVMSTQSTLQDASRHCWRRAARRRSSPACMASTAA